MGDEASKVKVFDKYGYTVVEASLDIALRMLRYIKESSGMEPSVDLSDSIRILENFDEYYSIMNRKFREYIIPQKSESDFIKGRVVVDKIKLIKKDQDNKMVLIQFDRRIRRDFIERVINNITSNISNE